MKKFAEDTKEFNKEKNWWETIPLVRESASDPRKPSAASSQVSTSGVRKVEVPAYLLKDDGKVARQQSSSGGGVKEGKVEKKEHRKHKHSRHHKEKERGGEDGAERTEQKLQRLRAERLQRERAESQRAMCLLAVSTAVKKEEAVKRWDRDGKTEVRRRLEQERSSGYNSQFNPDFARPRKMGGR